MPRPSTSLQPRKAPKQSRSMTTVQVIGRATIQVLQSQGLERLTTTRVAERAGVSVGTLYQYYSNRDALLLAVLRQHLDTVELAMVNTCDRMQGCSRVAMARALVHAFLDAKLAHVEDAHALAPVALLTSGIQAVKATTQRVQLATVRMLLTAPDIWREPRDGDPDILRATQRALVLTQALVGPVQVLVEAGAPDQACSDLRNELTCLAEAYWQSD